MNEWFSISSVSKKVNIPSETVRRYVRQYGDYLNIKRGEKMAYFVHESSLPTIKEIRYLLEQGYQHKQVKGTLDNGGVLPVQVDEEEGYKLQKQTLEEIQTLVKQNEKLTKLLYQMHDRMNKYEETLKHQASLNEQIHEQGKEQRIYESKRDDYLMKAMNEIHESRREVASTKEKKGRFIGLFRSN